MSPKQEATFLATSSIILIWQLGSTLSHFKQNSTHYQVSRPHLILHHQVGSWEPEKRMGTGNGDGFFFFFFLYKLHLMFHYSVLLEKCRSRDVPIILMIKTNFDIYKLEYMLIVQPLEDLHRNCHFSQALALKMMDQA